MMDDCWLWPGRLQPNGYAKVCIGGRRDRGGRDFYIHRLTYEALVGAIPSGLDLDHLCRVRHCYNPRHLEPVTRQENLRRGRHAGREKTHCPAGHPYDEANTYVDRHGHRFCRACNRAAQARRKVKL